MPAGMCAEGALTRKAKVALAKYRVVFMTSATEFDYARAGEPGPLYVTLGAAAAGESIAAVPLSSWKGTVILTANAAISRDARVAVAGTAGKVDDVSAEGSAIAVALEATTAADEEFEAQPIGSGTQRYVNIADSASVTNTAVETAFDKSVTLKGAALKVGDILEVIARANCVATNATDTLNVKLKVGTEVIAATGALDVANGDQALIHAFVVIRATGASGKLSASGITKIGGDAAVPKVIRLDEATEDISGDTAVTVTATWSVANAGNDVVLEDLIVLHHRASA